ncbi:hypothetical protein NGA_0525700, partial [Nannochloropsis gaditana CCMP526]|uniref:uncharacterized protein n=1 Tax=Nannochloropsis gaditana (strain CCMP526) TaxID=1093141 RepID=UPI00029F5D17
HLSEHGTDDVRVVLVIPVILGLHKEHTHSGERKMFVIVLASYIRATFSSAGSIAKIL